MTATHRSLLLTGLTAAVVAGTGLPASATYADTAAVPTTIATGTVAAPASISVNDFCDATTTTEKRTVHTDPLTGVQTQTAFSSTSSTAASTSNVNYYSSSSAAGPGLNETTTTTVTQNTTLSVTASWAASASRGVSGYLVNAHLGDGSVFPMAQTAPTVLTTGAAVDADYLAYAPRLSVTTLTTYGWTATTAQTPVLSC